MQINNLVDITAQKFERVVNFVSVNFALARQKVGQVVCVVVNMVVGGAS